MNDILSEIEKYKSLSEEPFPIVLFGSSNTAVAYNSYGRHNWGEWIHRVIRINVGMNFKILNSGVGGDTAEKLLARIERDVLYYRPKAVILTVGGNDCRKDVGLDVFKTRLNRIIDILEENNIITVMQTYYALDNSLFDDSVENEARIKREFPFYMEVVKEVAKERNLMLIDQYKYFEPLYKKDVAMYKKLMIDRMHVNYIGNFIMANNVARALELGEIEIPDDVKDEFNFFVSEMDALNK